MALDIIGITGGIGSGKSSVSRLLAAYCHTPLLDIDACCRDILHPGARGWLALEGAFGQRFFTRGGELDRPTFREALFRDQALRRQVDALLHPVARSVLGEELERLRHGKETSCFVEIPLLFEAGWDSDVHAIVVVSADHLSRCERIIARDGVTEESALKAIQSQMPLAEKSARADFVIDNSGSWQKTRKMVVDLAEKVFSPFCVEEIEAKRRLQRKKA